MGKSLNVKGKSAKMNRLSGFVPFCQISLNEDKAQIHEASVSARVHVRAAAWISYNRHWRRPQLDCISSEKVCLSQPWTRR